MTLTQRSMLHHVTIEVENSLYSHQCQTLKFFIVSCTHAKITYISTLVQEHEHIFREEACRCSEFNPCIITSLTGDFTKLNNLDFPM
jgi:succinyl-CoA synthetase beta subunit